MISKIFIAAAVFAVALAQHNGYSHGHGHGHAVSSQNIVLHQSHGHAQHVPIIAHKVPVIAHAPVIAQHNNDNGHGHGHAVSSQNIVLHQTHGYAQHAPVSHHAPVIAHAPIVHYQPTHHASHDEHTDHHAPAHYSFEYSVSDPHTGDIKSQQESREGDAVHGSYSLHEADGTVRRVEYTADKHTGFNAVVHREGHATHAAPAHHQPSHLSLH